MGGKTSTSSSSTSIPQDVLDRYNSVNAQAQTVAETPFQQYSTDPNAFVAPLDATQQAGITGTNQASNQAQPYYDAGAALTMAGSGSADPTALTGQDINQYLSPYLGTVVGNTSNLLNQQYGQAQTGALGSAITSGAFGGDRAGVAAANLQQQQSLAYGNTIGGLLNTGYNTALSTAQQQQGVDLSAKQADLARLSSAGQQIAGLGTGAQTASLQGATAQLAAGQTQQQTTQAGLTALYNQYLQQQGYPFQTTQFLANIAEGTGALSGSNTTTTQPSPFFSDERLKDDIEPIGKTFDGENIVKFRYKGSPQKHIGLLAQDVEKHHPEAVGLAGGFKTVDYDAATKDAAEKGHKHFGELERPKLAVGGSGGGPISLGDYASMLAAQQQGYEKAPWAQSGLYGNSQQGATPGKGSYVPSGNLPVSHLVTGQSTGVAPPKSDLAQLADTAKEASQITTAAQGMSKGASSLGDWWKGQTAAAPPPANIQSDPSPTAPYASGGRMHRDLGGVANDPQSSMPYENDNEIGIPDKQSKAAQLALLKDGVAPQQQASGLSQLAGAAGSIGALGSAAGTIGSGIESILPFLGLANGGVAGARHAYADGGGDDSDESLLGKWTKFFEPKTAAAAPVVTHDVAPVADNAPPQSANVPLPPERPSDLGGATVTASPDGAEIAAPQHEPGVAAPVNIPASDRRGLSGFSANAQNIHPDSAPSASPGGLGDVAGNIGNAVTQGGQNLGDWVGKNQNWMVPLLSGLGTMASSNSRYLGSALLQGLGGAANSYENVQNQQATRGLTGAQTAQEYGSIAGNTITDKNGVMYARVLENGEWVYKPVSQMMGSKGELTVPSGIGPKGAVVPDAIKPPTVSDAPAPPSPPSAPTLGGNVAKVPTISAPALAAAENFAPTASEVADGSNAVKNWAASVSPTAMDAIAPDYYVPQRVSADNMQRQKMLIMPLASALSQLPKDQSAATSGPVQETLKPITSYLNSLAQAAGIHNIAVKDSDLANQQEAEKLISQFQAQATGAAGLKSYDAFSALMHNVPSLFTAPGAQGKLFGQIMTQQQREIDENNYFTKFRSLVGGDNGMLAPAAARSGQKADQNFTTRYDSTKFYQPEAAALAKIYNMSVTNPATGVTAPMFKVIQDMPTGTPLPPEIRSALTKAGGDKILRYFGLQ